MCVSIFLAEYAYRSKNTFALQSAALHFGTINKCLPTEVAGWSAKMYRWLLRQDSSVIPQRDGLMLERQL